MLTKQFWQKTSQATATTALGIAVLAAMETAPANAANLKTFNISGNFGDENFIIPGVYNDYPPDLLDVNGSFVGNFTVDVDKVPTTTYIDLESWDVGGFRSSGPPNFGRLNAGTQAPQYLSFTTDQYYSLNLFVDNNLKPYPIDVGLGAPVYGTYEVLAGKYDFGTGIYVTSFRSEPVPEPFTLGGTAIAGTIGWWLRCKRKASHTV
jgi:hypothetical protein